MALPSLYSISTGKSIQTAFGGLNESYACAEAEFTEMKNFSSRGYPALQTRTPRRTMRAMGRCNGMYHLNGLLLCEGTTLRYTEDSEDNYMQEIAAWTSKRARGEDYQLTSGSWREQMDAYQNMMVGMTVDEVETWFGRYFSAENGRPLTENSSSDADRARWEAFSDDDRARAADIVSGATMSLRDAHGDILTAIRRAWEDAQKSE